MCQVPATFLLYMVGRAGLFSLILLLIWAGEGRGLVKPPYPINSELNNMHMLVLVGNSIAVVL